MRLFVLLVGLALIPGCGGSKADAPVDLSIENPKQAEQESQAQATDVETPENARKLLVQAARMAKQGLVGKSAELLSHAISMNPEDPELYIARAEVYGIMREDASALADYSTAVRVRPSDASIHNRRGFFLLSRNEFMRAVKDFSEAIRLNPDSPQAHNNRGLVYLSLNEPKKALADFSKAVKLDPKYADAWNNRGFAQYKQKQYKAALGDLTKAIQIKPDYINALNNRGLVYLAMKNHAAVVSDMTAAIKASPNEIKLFRARRTAYLELKDFDKARQDASKIEWLVRLASMTQAIDKSPLEFRNYMQRGLYLADGGEHEAAVRDFSRAAQLNNSTSEPLVARARSSRALDKSGEAIRALATVI
ncbi:MAG: tetratricopeptide repeat protein [Planctomycetaceae bacterium]